MTGELKGYSRPFSPQGRAATLPPMPWRFASTQMLFHFRADPDVLDSYLPPPMTPNPERRGEAFLWSPHHNSHPVSEDADGPPKNPDRTNYNVCVIAVPGLFNGQPRLISAYQWCDRDWLVVLSWLIGTCAKEVEFRNNGIHPMFGRVGSHRTGDIGTTFTRTISRYGEQLIRMSCTLEEDVDVSALDVFTSTMPMLSERHIPDFHVRPSGRPLVHDLTCITLEDSLWQDVRRGTGTLEFNAEADNEELGALQPTEIINVYRWEGSWMMTGIDVVHDYLAEK